MSSKQAEKKMDPRVKRTRQALQQALLALMAEKSFQSITVQDVAERATVNRVTFYAHFQDKYALLEHTMRELIHERLRSQVPEGTSFSPDNLARLIQTVCEFLVEMGSQCRPPHGQMDQLMEKQFKAAIYDVLQPWAAEMPGGNDQQRHSPNQAAVAASWAIYGVAAQWSEKETREPAGELVRQVLPMILAGLRPLSDSTRRKPVRQPATA